MPRMRRHLEGAHLQQAAPAARESGEYSLSMQNSARCVLPVNVHQQMPKDAIH